MYCDIPILKRCCFCIPLRPGLIVWGYFRLTLSIVLVAIVSIILSENIRHFCYFITSHVTSCVVAWSLLLVISLVDALFQYILLMAAHTKNTKLMKSYLCYNVIMFAVSNLVFLILFVYLVVTFDKGGMPSFEWLLICLIIGFISAVFQFYIILLVRSEIRKQNNDCYVTFGNHEGNPKCFMSFGNPIETSQDLQRLTIHDDTH